MSRSLILIIGIVVAGSLCWFFPLFHIAPLDRAAMEKVAAGFNPKEFAGKFWDERLLKSLDQAVKADVLLPAIQTNAGQARKQFARSVGVSESYTFFLSGRGRVLTVNDDEQPFAEQARAQGLEDVEVRDPRGNTVLEPGDPQRAAVTAEQARDLTRRDVDDGLRGPRPPWREQHAHHR
jgi:hypothetical protein